MKQKRPSLIECAADKKNSTGHISCADTDIENSYEYDSFITPPDNADRKIKYHNFEQQKFQRFGINSKNLKSARDSSPLSTGMITLRRINLFKSTNMSQLCVVETPIVHSLSIYSMSDAISDGSVMMCDSLCPSFSIKMANLPTLQAPSPLNLNKQNECENVTDFADIFISKQKPWEQASQTEVTRLPTFVSSKDRTDSLYSGDHRLKNLCDPFVDTSAKRRKNAIGVKSSKTSNLLRSYKVASEDLSSIPSICSDVLQTVSNGGNNCESFTETSDLTNVEFCNNKECSEHMQEWPINVVEFKTPAVPVQFTSQSCLKKRSYSCGNISLSSFDDYSFSPVQFTLPLDSSQEISNFITERSRLSIPSDISTNQNIILSSGCEKHDANEKINLESIKDNEIERITFQTVGLKQHKKNGKHKILEAKVKLTKTRAIKAKNSLKTDDGLGKQVIQNHLWSGECKENKFARSERSLEATTSSFSRDLTEYPAVEKIENCEENLQRITYSKINPIVNLRRSKRIINTHSSVVNLTKISSLYTEKAQPLQTNDSETLTGSLNRTDKELRRREYESVNSKANSMKNSNIAFNRADIFLGIHKHKKDQRVVNRTKISAELNELEVSGTRQIDQKHGKKTSLKANKGLNSLFGSEGLASMCSETGSSNVVNPSSKLTRRPNSQSIGSQKLCISVTSLNAGKEQKKGSRAKSKHMISNCSPTKSKQTLSIGFDNHCETSNVDEMQSYIHPQSSFSGLQSSRTNSSKKKLPVLKNIGEITFSFKRKSDKLPEKCGIFTSNFGQSFERINKPEVKELQNIKMPLRQLRKRKTYSTVTEVLPDESLKKASIIIRSKIKPEKKLGEVDVSSIIKEHVKIRKCIKKSFKKESVLEVVSDNGNTEKAEEQQDGLIASTVVTAKRPIKHDLLSLKKISQSEAKVQSECEENTRSTLRQASQKFVGAHCSIAGGVSNAVKEAALIGARAFGLFVRNGRTWKLNTLKPAEAEKFKEACKEHGFLPHLILPHGSYLLNCGSSNPDTLQKSRDTLIHEIQICEMLGLDLYNFHPGSTCGQVSVNNCLETIAESINIAHENTHHVKTVIENMSCQGSTVGGKFEELRAIIDGVKDKSRIGVCLDTCHAFAAGFDLSSESGLNKCLEDFDRIVGLQYLCAMHLNDSKGKLGCHLDRHENIGKGHIGMEGFRCVMNDPRLNNIPMILETPVNDYAKEIKILCELENH